MAFPEDRLLASTKLDDETGQTELQLSYVTKAQGDSRDQSSSLNDCSKGEVVLFHIYDTDWFQ